MSEPTFTLADLAEAFHRLKRELDPDRCDLMHLAVADQLRQQWQRQHPQPPRPATGTSARPTTANRHAKPAPPSMTQAALFGEDTLAASLGGSPPSRYQQAIYDAICAGTSALLINAVAGSGKTSTLIGAIQRLPRTATGCLFAFNRHNVQTLQSRLKGHPGFTASTIHSLGNGLLKKLLPGLSGEPDRGKYRAIAYRLVTMRLLPERCPEQFFVTESLRELADFTRLTLTPPDDPEAVLAMAIHYNLLLDGPYFDACIRLVPEVIAEGERQAREDAKIDYTDQVYLPSAFRLPAEPLEYVFVDEAQDLSRAQLELVMKVRGAHIVFVGDEFQAINGFAGAESDSMQRIAARTGAVSLPLSVNYRCPVSHLRLAQVYVPHIEPRQNAPEGTIEDLSEDDFLQRVRPGNLVLARFTEPLIRHCIRLVRTQVPARVKGRNVGRQLTDIIRALTRADDYAYTHLGMLLTRYRDDQAAKLRQRENAEDLLLALADRVATVRTCYEAMPEVTTADDLCARMLDLFREDRPHVLFSSIHRAKGLEQGTVYLLDATAFPYRFKHQRAWQIQQEDNVHYVSLTRSMNALYLVRNSTTT